MFINKDADDLWVVHVYQYASIHIYERSSKTWASGADVEAPSSLRSFLEHQIVKGASFCLFTTVQDVIPSQTPAFPMPSAPLDVLSRLGFFRAQDPKEQDAKMHRDGNMKFYAIWLMQFAYHMNSKNWIDGSRIQDIYFFQIYSFYFVSHMIKRQTVWILIYDIIYMHLAW